MGEASGVVYLVFMYWLGVLQIACASWTLLMTASFSKADIFTPTTVTAEVVIAVSSAFWILITFHKLSKFAVFVNIALMAGVIVLAMTVPASLDELRVCYFIEKDAFKALARCRDQVPTLCDSKSLDDTRLGMCMASWAAESNIEAVQWLGSITAAAVVIQVAAGGLMVMLYYFWLRSKLDRDVKATSNVQLAMMLEFLRRQQDLALKQEFVLAAEDIGKFSREEADQLLGDGDDVAGQDNGSDAIDDRPLSQSALPQQQQQAYGPPRTISAKKTW